MITVKNLIEKVQEIMQLAQDIKGENEQDESRLNQIYQICQDIEVDWQIEKRLNEHTKISE